MPSERSHGEDTSSSEPTSVAANLASLDAKLKLMAQRLKILENNEQVIGRTIVNLGKKQKELETTAAAGGTTAAADLGKLKAALREELKADIKANPLIAPPLEDRPMARGIETSDVKDIRKEIESLRQQINEIKYVVDSINPLEYITLEQLDEVVDRKLDKRMKK